MRGTDTEANEVIDAHQHFWHYDPSEHTWMTPDQQVLMRDYLPVDLEKAAIAAGVSGTVAVQARRSLEETGWLLSLAATEPLVRGVVGWFDFESPTLEGDLERFAADPLLVGARELVHDMPGPDYAVSAVHRHGVAAVGRAGLAYDLLLRPEHLAAATALVDEFTDQRFVVDHVAKPAVSRGELEPWAAALRTIAEREHVYCKLSGLVTEADWTGWRPEQFTPFFEVAIEAFGPDRLMFGSDWPVCLCAGEYLTVMRLLESALGSLSDAERRAVMGDNAKRFYRLPDPPATRRDEQVGERRDE